MKKMKLIGLLVSVIVFAACSQESNESKESTVTESPAEPVATEVVEQLDMEAAVVEIVPGLTMRLLAEGHGEVAQAGQTVSVHYTGWLHDATAAGARGEKFDSSVDRGQPFAFPLGAGRVIEGWDQGVLGMQIGEVRELIIAPEMAYGDRAVGSIIEPGSTLVFQVELLDLSGGEATSSE